MEVSHPPNWSTAIPKFYHASLPVTFSKTAGGYVAVRDGHYVIQRKLPAAR